MKNNNKGFTLVELIVSFSLVLVVLIYLLRTIIVISNKSNELLVTEEYIVYESILLDNIYDDLDELNSSVNIFVTSIDNGFKIVDNELTFDLENNIIKYDDTIYELPENIIFSDNPYELVTDGSSYYIININLKVNNNDKVMKIICQNSSS